VDLVPASPSDTEPLRAEDAPRVVAPVAMELLPTTIDVVEPSAAPLWAATRTELATEAANRATGGRLSVWLIAALVIGVVVLLAAPWAFMRRRKQVQAAAQPRRNVQKARARRPADPLAGMDVVEGRLVRTPSSDKTASIGGLTVEPAADSGGISPTGLDDLALTLGPTDSVDLDIGAPVVINERIDWFAARADSSAIEEATVDDDTIEETAATARMPDVATVRADSSESAHDVANRPMDDEQMTLTIVELDLLRQDYEAERTLTHEASQALRDAVADLKATKAARAAIAETSTLELLELSQAEATESGVRPRPARVRKK
jgi:hypothetical protein